ncbi:OmpA family protein [Pontibacter arcticus]|uniref:Flagellar motor protein MotB n=1 Tax=Pontibacter arcticus TaxID=2080288 RepID=A0A364RJM7_9BACT|nr:OmpA family protein [Pontibacter arcticus]RAU84448.1 flagellar motor protein MotB [Pontibacter arcticus]
MKKNYKLLYIAFAAVLGFAPVAEAQSTLRKGNKHFENYEFALALKEYQHAIEKRTPTLQTTQRIAEAYRLTRQSQQAEVWYGKLVNMQGSEPMNLFHFAEALRNNGKYAEAKEQYMQWSEAMPEKEAEAQQLMAACDMAIKWINSPAVAEIKPFQRVNYAEASDFGPMPFNKGIIFTSDRGAEKADKKQKVYGWTGRPYLQLFTAEQDVQGNWSSPVAMQDIVNADFHNTTASTNNDKLYFTRTNMVLKRGPINADPTSWVNKKEVNEYVNRLEIYTAEKNGTEWSNIQPFAYNKVEAYSVGHPAISPDGNILYFVSDMPGGLGDTDIYYAVKKSDGTWGKPVNAGTTINTPRRESFPYVDANGKLFFASDGHAGLGGLDVFAAEGEHANWTTVKNVGFPVNSSKNDYGIMFTEAGKKGLISSNRDAENGTDDIYEFKMLGRPVVIAVSTAERAQNAKKRNVYLPLANVRLAILQQGIKDSIVVMSDNKGQYTFKARVGDNYTTIGTKPAYLKQEAITKVEEAAGDTIKVAMIFDRNELQKPVVLENIYYDLDKWAIRPDAAKELDKLVIVLKNNPAINIELSSHTDSRETKKYNQLLSERRAKAAVDYIISQGIDKARLKSKGYGETRLLNGCKDGVRCSEEDHQLNRRTEFKIIRN